MDSVSANAVLVTVVSMAILISWEKVLAPRSSLFKIIPGPLAAVVFGIVFQAVTSRFFPALALSPEHLVSVPVFDSLGELGGALVSPAWSEIGNPAVWVTATSSVP